MRTSKAGDGGSWLTTYLYDGQMGIQDIEQNAVTNYGLGARGIDVILRTDSTGTGIGFPVYDLHGNMVATLGRTGSGSWSIGNERSFDAWGNVRSGSGVNTGRYCANLGHKQDDESGLTYMRARYYEGASGRFVSEDSKRDGPNWFAYARLNPVSNVDKTGCEAAGDADGIVKIIQDICKQFGWTFEPPKLFGLVVDYMAKMAVLGTLSAIMNGVMLAGSAGFGGGLFTGNPLLAGLCGMAVFAGMVGMAVVNTVAIFETYNFIVSLYILDTEQ